MFRDHCMNVKIEEENVIYFYGEEQPLLTNFKKAHPKVQLVNNIFECETALGKNQDPKILVLDDLLNSVINDKKINVFVTLMFTQRSHHR